MPLQLYDPLITIRQKEMVEQLGDTVFLGNWFVFVKASSVMAEKQSSEGVTGTGSSLQEPQVLFRGKNQLTLPGVQIQPTPLPRCQLVSLTSDKMLYRADRDTVRLLIAALDQANTELTLRLMLNGKVYAEYPLVLDEYGLCLWSMRSLPEGEYVATVVGSTTNECRFEVAEYRLAALNAELVEQQMSGDTLRYVLSVTVFNQPYSGPVEIELQERGQRVGERTRLQCNRDGQCRGAVKLSGAGPYTLNVIAGERTATVALKGSEQEWRESLTISELGEVRLLSLLPMPQANACRGMYITRGGANTEPFLVRRLIGNEIEITPRTDTELLRIAIVNPVRGTSDEKLYKQVKADEIIRVAVPSPYGILLLGAFVNGQAWEGWCTALRPSELRLQCEAPKEAKPGSRITVTLKTGVTDRVVPVQLIVKDQRLIAQSDPQVEFAACIKKNMSEWQQQSVTGVVERRLAQVNPAPRFSVRTGMLRPHAMSPAMPMMADAAPASGSMAPTLASGVRMTAMAAVSGQTEQVYAGPTTNKIRLSFPEVVYNAIVKVRQGQADVEVTLGDSMTRYSVEAFALSPETLDWQRVETSVQAVQPVYGELSVSPFVFPGDPVMGRLDVGAASGGAIVEVRHDGEVLPLFSDTGSEVTPGLPIPSGSVVRFPVRPGAITAMVRDARKGGVDVSERYVTAPGRMRHILRRLRLLTAGEEVTLQGLQAVELKPMPGLERPFQFFVEGASKYPFGCVEQTSTKLLAMYVGYVSNQQNEELASDYKGAMLVWYKRLESMYLPQSGFCLYPPEEGGARTPDTHYAPLAVKHLLNLPTAERSGLKQPALLKTLDRIRAMANDAAAYYKIDNPPRTINDCHDAYRVLVSATASHKDKEQAVSFVRSRLVERGGRTLVAVPEQDRLYNLYGAGVSERAETAYAAAVLLTNGESSDVSRAIDATNTLTDQMNEEGRLYSTVDTAACLALLTALRDTGIVSDGDAGRVVVNGQEMSLREALAYQGEVESIGCLEGIAAVQVTAEVFEDWGTFKGQLAVEVRLERKGHIQQQFNVGDELELVMRVRQYEPGLIAHVCLPDVLARIVGGVQVKRFSLDFCEKNELRVPLAAVGSTYPLVRQQGGENLYVQHWAVIVRNMFKEEQVGNPGLLEVEVM